MHIDKRGLFDSLLVTARERNDRRDWWGQGGKVTERFQGHAVNKMIFFKDTVDRCVMLCFEVSENSIIEHDNGILYPCSIFSDKDLLNMIG